jgi:hypothetical protein
MEDLRAIDDVLAGQHSPVQDPSDEDAVAIDAVEDNMAPVLDSPIAALNLVA